MGRRDWPLRFYSRERLFSVEARRTFVAPDLACASLSAAIVRAARSRRCGKGRGNEQAISRHDVRSGGCGARRATIAIAQRRGAVRRAQPSADSAIAQLKALYDGYARWDAKE